MAETVLQPQSVVTPTTTSQPSKLELGVREIWKQAIAHFVALLAFSIVMNFYVEYRINRIQRQFENQLEKQMQQMPDSGKMFQPPGTR